MARIAWGRILAGVAAVAAGGAAYVYLRQRAARAPLYQAIASDGLFEIRRYPALLAIETIQHGTRDRALGAGFGLLADYMFGDGREGDEIPMTLPFLAEPLAAGTGGRDWRIRFLIPEGHSPESLPAPPEGIAIVEVPAREIAAIKVAGQPSDRSFAGSEKKLAAWLAGRGRNASGAAEHAYYNSPLLPGPVRPNEVLIPLG